MKNRIISLLAVGVFGGAAVAHAALMPTFSFDVSDSWIEVGETFSVDVGLTGVDSSLGNLTGFSFEVDPFGSLSLFQYQGATVGSAFLDFSDPSNPNDVTGGLFDLSTGSDIHLATLSFLAIGVGSEMADLEGALADFRGLFFATADFSVFTDLNIDTSLRLASVPEPSTYGLAGAGLVLALIAVRARRSRRATPAA